MRIVGLVERDSWCRDVLSRRWPDAVLHDDVDTTPEWWSSTRRPRVDVVTAGFPCQPFSFAGNQKGMQDERWKWPATAAVIRAVRPRYIVVENVAALVRDGWAWGTVLADLHRLGFDAEWSTLFATQFGAPHNRERVYLVAYPSSDDGWDKDPSASPWEVQLEPRGSSGRHRGGHWIPEPSMGRVAHGLPRRFGVQRPTRARKRCLPANPRAHRPTRDGPRVRARQTPRNAPASVHDALASIEAASISHRGRRNATNGRQLTNGDADNPH